MQVKEMKQLIKDAAEWTESATNLVGDSQRDESATICAQIAIAKALTVIAAAMVERQIRAEFQEEVEEMRQERQARERY